MNRHGIALLLIVLTGCKYLDIDKIKDDVSVVSTTTTTTTIPPVVAPVPVIVDQTPPPYSAHSGRWPDVVHYYFTLEGGGILEFRYFHSGDYWGGMPAAGWGHITWADGRVESFDVNGKLRHRTGPLGPIVSMGKHGKRYRRSFPGKTIDEYEDGWIPLAEQRVTEAVPAIGYPAVVDCRCEIEAWQ